MPGFPPSLRLKEHQTKHTSIIPTERLQEISWQDFWRSHAPRGASYIMSGINPEMLSKSPRIRNNPEMAYCISHPELWVSFSAYLNLTPAEIRYFLNAFYGFEAPEKNKITARWGGGLPTCLRNRRFHGPSWSKMHLK